jgi:uncharacterized glyoxalase superfamily protein PhnB
MVRRRSLYARDVPVRTVRPILNVSDVRASLAWFETLGWETTFVWDDDHGEPGFAGTGSGDAEIFLCRDGQGSRDTRPSAFPFDESTGGVWLSWFLESPREVDAIHASAVERGLSVTMAPTDEPWGVREFHLRHPDGHTFRIGAYRVR